MKISVLQSSQIILEVEILVELLLYLFAIVRDVVSMMAKTPLSLSTKKYYKYKSVKSQRTQSTSLIQIWQKNLF